MNDSHLTIALPSKGHLYKPTMDFLEACALHVHRDSERQYQTRMKGIANEMEVVFQRPRDIPKLVEEGGVDLGITGFDIFYEMGGEMKSGECVPVFPDGRTDSQIPALPYGACSLVLAVPDHWVDIVSISDLAEMALVRKREGRMLKVATEFPNLTKEHLFKQGVSYFELTEIDGAAESTPRMGSADIVADLKSSGVTLAENRLKEIAGGKILDSSACLIASRRRLMDKERQRAAQLFIDRIEAHLNASRYWLITANVTASSEEDVFDQFSKNLKQEEIDLLGQEGPTVARVLCLKKGRSLKYSVYSIRIQVESEKLEKVIAILRAKSGRNILVSPASFVYDEAPRAFGMLLKKLKQGE